MIIRTASRLRRDSGAWPSMTPMVDVVLVILIFFMASAALLGPEWFLQIRAVAAEMNEGETDPFELGPAVLVVRLDRGAGEAVVVSGAGLDGAPLEELEGAFESLVREAGGGGFEVIVEPGDDVPYEAVVRAAEMATRAGVERMGLR